MMVKVDPVAVKTATVDPVVKDPVVDPVAVPVAVPVVAEGEDAGEEPVPEEDRTRILDDVTIGAKKRSKRIDITLDDMHLVMRQDTERAEYYEKAVGRVQKLCDEASTLQALDNCEDELTKLSEKFYK